jgi:hypothetical protein
MHKAPIARDISESGLSQHYPHSSAQRVFTQSGPKAVSQERQRPTRSRDWIRIWAVYLGNQLRWGEHEGLAAGSSSRACTF